MYNLSSKLEEIHYIHAKEFKITIHRILQRAMTWKGCTHEYPARLRDKFVNPPRVG